MMTPSQLQTQMEESKKTFLSLFKTLFYITLGVFVANACYFVGFCVTLAPTKLELLKAFLDWFAGVLFGTFGGMLLVTALVVDTWLKPKGKNGDGDKKSQADAETR